MKLKKQIAAISTSLLVVLFIFSGCGDGDKSSPKTQSEPVKEQYQCPMKCTNEVFDKPGKCPVCGMELEKTTSI